MTALLLAVALADYVAEKTDHVDGEPGERRIRATHLRARRRARQSGATEGKERRQ